LGWTHFAPPSFQKGVSRANTWTEARVNKQSPQQDKKGSVIMLITGLPCQANQARFVLLFVLLLVLFLFFFYSFFIPFWCLFLYGWEPVYIRRAIGIDPNAEA
jgi:hypothetical protein